MSWNCRGIGVAMTVRALRDLVSHYHPSLLFLCETKAKKRKVDHLRRILAFDHGFVVDASGRSGGLALFWKNDVTVSVLSFCKNFIHTKVDINDSSFSGYVTGVYGDPIASLRKLVWNKISNLHVPRNKPWLCCGDFNSILSQDEKLGLRPSDNRCIELFRSFLDHNNLLDMELKGCKYTWCNNRESGLVQERIDRMLSNGPWQFAFPDATLTALPALGSDHTPLILQLQKQRIRRYKRFSYEEFWDGHEELPVVVDSGWGNSSSNSIVEKINNVRRALEDWSTQKFKKAPIKIAKLKKTVMRLENANDAHMKFDEIKKCKEEIGKLWEQEELYWRARSRLQWLKGGDKNSKYFHATTIHKRSRNRITRLKDGTGVWIEDDRGLQSRIKDHFSSLFDSSNPTTSCEITSLIQPKIDADTNHYLIRPVEEWEVKQAVFGLGANKAPGPDGLSGLFYQKHWNSIKSDVVQLVSTFFSSAVFPKDINETHIALIPKVARPEEVGQLCPISCGNFIYKVISKVMADRLKGLMKGLISDSQSAFVGGRQIQDNIFIAHEIFHSLKSNRGKRTNALVVKLDMSKAYDRLEWGFLADLMRALGFGDHWINMTLTCISTVSYRIKFNGDLGECFSPRRGLRQGDPLSPIFSFWLQRVYLHY